MPDIIQLLPDSVANQIAAGEVVQRPASVVKELIENALDAGADEIIVHVKDAGRTLIQITDNGCGMSPTDARMAFERHATSKIREANDLFAIRTMGFRGEALASIAAIADVELRTKRMEDETGTYLHINATNVITQEPAGCAEGSSIQVKNLFFNVPARRKFLRSSSTELKHIINEIQRVAIPNPDIAIALYHNNAPVYELPKANLRKRLMALFGKNIGQSLVPVESATSLVTLSGFVGQPRFARKTMGEQFFFVNRRYMRHPYFHKAVMQAYEKLLPPDAFPAYFIFLEIDPASIDINVHPTKTEIKFEDDRAIWQILYAAVRESLGKHSVVPSIDFDQEGSIDIPMPAKAGAFIPVPEIAVDPAYNPFNETASAAFRAQPETTPLERNNLRNWQQMYGGLESSRLKFDKTPDEEEPAVFTAPDFQFSGKKALQLKQRYILTPVKSGVMVIDQKRAQERILYEKFLEVLKTEAVASQQLLFPHTFELNPADATLLKEIIPDLAALGFDIREFGKETFIVSGVPGALDSAEPSEIVEKLLEEFKNSPVDARVRAREQIAASLAKASAINYGTELHNEEMDHLIDQLFACSSPNYSPDGKPAIAIVPLEDIEKYFGK